MMTSWCNLRAACILMTTLVMAVTIFRFVLEIVPVITYKSDNVFEYPDQIPDAIWIMIYVLLAFDIIIVVATFVLLVVTVWNKTDNVPWIITWLVLIFFYAAYESAVNVYIFYLYGLTIVVFIIRLVYWLIRIVIFIVAVSTHIARLFELRFSKQQNDKEQNKVWSFDEWETRPTWKNPNYVSSSEDNTMQSNDSRRPLQALPQQYKQRQPDSSARQQPDRGRHISRMYQEKALAPRGDYEIYRPFSIDRPNNRLATTSPGASAEAGLSSVDGLMTSHNWRAADGGSGSMRARSKNRWPAAKPRRDRSITDVSSRISLPRHRLRDDDDDIEPLDASLDASLDRRSRVAPEYTYHYYEGPRLMSLPIRP